MHHTLNPVYTIQPVVKLPYRRVVQLAVSCKQTSNRVERTAVRLTGCQYGLYNWFDNPLYRVYKHLPGCQTGSTTGCIV